MAVETYFVCSSGDEPHQIMFSLEDAQASRSEYIDVFDEKGYPVTAWKLVDGKYTHDF